jgi:hypothetical protein
MQLQKASRKKAKMRLTISGPSGSGKTYSALLVGYGLTGNLSKVCVIDTENSSAELYAHLGDYNTIQLAAPFVPEKFIDAIRLCEKAEIETIIIDSASHEWDGLGGILDIHTSIPGNSFTAWSKVTPRHNAFIQTMLQSSCHIITTIRSKTEYVLSDKNGKQVPEKVGMKGIQKEGFEYDATLAFELNINHTAHISKDRTGLFIGKHDFALTPEVGRKIKQWCEEGASLNVEDVLNRINDCRTIQELLTVYSNHPEFNGALQPEFERKKRNILINQEVQKELAHQKISTNGTAH